LPGCKPDRFFIACLPSNAPEDFYTTGEKRVSIFSKYDPIGNFKTFRDDTAICKVLKTPFGDLVVYGTVIGTEGNRKAGFTKDLDHQLADFDKIAGENNLCIAGDFNISFGDNYYFTGSGRQKINDSFAKLGLENLTSAIPNNIDHIVLPKKFIAGRSVSSHTWDLDKKLSDHIGVSITIV